MGHILTETMHYGLHWVPPNSYDEFLTPLPHLRMQPYSGSAFKEELISVDPNLEALVPLQK